MHRANIPLRRRYTLAGEAFLASADLNGLNLVDDKKGGQAPKDVLWDGKLPGFAKNLRTWGEAGVVKLKNKATPKIADRGKQCMFVGYAKQHSGDCFRMWNPSTGGYHETRDVIWLNRMYYGRIPEDEGEALIEVGLPIEGNVNAFDEESIGEDDNEGLDHIQQQAIEEDSDDEEMPVLMQWEGDDSDDESSLSHCINIGISSSLSS